MFEMIKDRFFYIVAHDKIAYEGTILTFLGWAGFMLWRSHVYSKGEPK